MNEVKKLNEGAKFAHVTVGQVNGFEGKAFLKETLGLTSCEVSLGTLPKGASVPFFHSHKENEEVYIVLSGAGHFQIDADVFDVAEGSVVRVSTHADRNIKCTSDAPMTYICIQAKEGSLNHFTADDCEIKERENLM